METTEYKTLIAPMLNRVPASFSQWSSDKTRVWKALVAKARTAIEKKKITEEDLKTLYLQLLHYEQNT